MDLYVDRMTSPIGAILLVWQQGALRALDFEDDEQRLYRLLRLHYGAYRLIPARAPAEIRDPIEAYFRGEITAIDKVPVQASGTVFQRQVWTALREIPAGGTRTYGELAARIGRPGASRAVGAANASNPVGIVAPCHRVIGSNGALTGYAGGIDRKRWLLAHEHRALNRCVQVAL